MIRIGIVGHRFLNQQEAGFAGDQCRDILESLLLQHKDIVACSAIAEGADAIFASAGLALNIPLEIVLPFDEYEFDFVEDKAREIFRTLKAAAAKTTNLPYGKRSVDAYVAGMHWILNNTDIIVAVWNGEKNDGPGGTADAVSHIVNNGLSWVHIDTSNYTTIMHINQKDDNKF